MSANEGGSVSPPAAAERPLLSLRETAAWLRVSPWTVRRLAGTGALPMVRIGKQLRFEQGAIADYTEASQRGE